MLEGMGFQMTLDQNGMRQSVHGSASHLVILCLILKAAIGGIYSEEECDICVFKKVTAVSMWMSWRRANGCRLGF